MLCGRVFLAVCLNADHDLRRAGVFANLLFDGLDGFECRIDQRGPGAWLIGAGVEAFDLDNRRVLVERVDALRVEQNERELGTVAGNYAA